MTHIVFNKQGEAVEVGLAPKRQYIFTLIDHNNKKTTKTYTATSKKFGATDYQAEQALFDYKASGKYASVDMIVHEWRNEDDPYFHIDDQN